MKDPKKPRRNLSGSFEFIKPTLGPSAPVRLPPVQGSLPSMAPIKVPATPEAPPAPETEALPSVPITEASDAAVAPAPPPSSTPPAPGPASLPPLLSLPPEAARGSSSPSLARAEPRPRFSRRSAVLLFVVASVALGVIWAARRRPDLLTGGAGASPGPGFAETFDVRTFQRGNVHTHTTRSDGRQSPRDVALWYRDHGYQFLAISDHDALVDPSEFADVQGPGFVLLPAEEISSTAGDRPVHALAVCVERLIPSGHFDTAAQALAAAAAAVRAQNGFLVLNHPNFSWAFGVADLATVPGAYALEIWSGHPASHSQGDPTHPSHEAMWDELLTRQRQVTGVAVDDVHTLASEGKADEALPGRAWIATFGELDRLSVCNALRAGRFYASSGVALRRIRVDRDRVSVWVGDARDTVDFITSAAHVLASVSGDAFGSEPDGFVATYVLRGGEPYVRVEIRSPDGASAWTQAYPTRF